MGDWERRYGITDTQMSSADGHEAGKKNFNARTKIILGLLLDHEDGLTAREIHNFLCSELDKDLEIHATRPRITELGPDTRRSVNLNLIETVGRKPDPQTGINISVWRLMPEKVRYVESLLKQG